MTPPRLFRRTPEHDGPPEQDSLPEPHGLGGLQDAAAPIWDLETGGLVAFHIHDPTSPEPPDPTTPHTHDGGATPAVVDLDAWRHDHVRHVSQRLGIDAPRTILIPAPLDMDSFRLSHDDTESHPHVLGITEDVLSGDVAATLRAISVLREKGWAIAVLNPALRTRTLALLPLLNPELVTLDIDLVDAMEPDDAAELVHFVGAHVESAQNIILITGIRTPHDVVRARAYGATLGRGPFLDETSPLRLPLPRVSGIGGRFAQRPAEQDRDTPFTVVSERRESRAGTRELLMEITTHLERRASTEPGLAIMLTSFQDARNLTPRVMDRYRRTAESAALVSIFARGLDARATDDSITRTNIADSDPLCQEWNIIVISPTISAVLTARQTNTSTQDAATYEFVFSRDRRLAIAAAQTLIQRMNEPI